MFLRKLESGFFVAWSPVYQSLTDHTWYKHKIVPILAKIVVTVFVFECSILIMFLASRRLNSNNLCCCECAAWSCIFHSVIDSALPINGASARYRSALIPYMTSPVIPLSDRVVLSVQASAFSFLFVCLFSIIWAHVHVHP